jgi:hypothetical protein
LGYELEELPLRRWQLIVRLYFINNHGTQVSFEFRLLSGKIKQCVDELDLASSPRLT